MNNQFIQRVIFDWNRIDNDSYLKEIEAFKGIEKLDFNKPITFFVGENGSGKSTLLEALAVAHGFNPEGGTKNYVFIRTRPDRVNQSVTFHLSVALNV